MDKYAQDAGEWRLAAESTFSGALMLFRSPNFFVWFPAAILAHHALEKLLKSALIREGYAIAKGERPHCVWGHDLVALARRLASKRPDFPLEVSRDLAVFDAFFDELRYPRAVERVDYLGQEERILFTQLMERIRPFAAPFRNPFTGEET
jgi:HEPN domain-containing protein